MKKITRRIVAPILAFMVIVSGIGAGDLIIKDIGVGTAKKQVNTSYKKPEQKKTQVEVYSEDGHMKHVTVNEMDMQDGLTRFSKNKNTSLAMTKEEMKKLRANDLGFKTVDIINNGSDLDNYCILICGDGFTANQQDAFLKTAREISEYFLTREPFSYSDVRSHINIRAVMVTSNQSGVSMDPNNPYDTFFKTTFNNNGIERLICIHDYDRLRQVIAQYMPECAVPFVIGNSTTYGGSGGSVCTISNNSQARDIAFHEFGHTSAGLADEYWETTTASTNGYEAPNRTAETDPSKCKWSKFIGKNGVGLYEFEENRAWHRPHQSCEMRYLNQEFCDVCKDHLAKTIVGNVAAKIKENEVINTAAELKNYIERANKAPDKTASKTVTLNKDITLPSANYISPFNSFRGTFNGNGHTISNLTININQDNNALFKKLENGAVIKNLYLKNVNITGKGFYTAGLVSQCYGRIEQCGVQGSISSNNATGGIVGELNGGTIKDCYSDTTVNASAQVAGGIVGWLSNGTINNCFAYGKSTAGDNYWQGGICGYKPGGSISNCHYNTNQMNKGIGDGNNGTAGHNASEFSGTTVLNALNNVSNVWKQSNPYPIFKFGSVEVTTTAQPTTVPETYYSHIYQDINYGGNSIGLPLGRFTTSQLISRGFKNDDLSSIKVSNGYRAILYTEDNFTGSSRIITSDTSWIGSDFNDVVSSIVVEKQPVTTAKPTTAQQTTTPQVTTTAKITTKPYKSGIAINGYQISTTNLGIRTVYSVSGKYNGKNVVESGMIYGLSDKAGNEALTANSNNKYIKKLVSTNKGKLDKTYSDFDDVSSYAMTITYTSGNKNEFIDAWKMRAYAKLSDGTYVYSNEESFSGYLVAKNLYESRKMKTASAHNMLYDKILKVVDENFKKINY